MGSWGDTFTEQLRGDIFIDQQQPLTRPLTTPCPGCRIAAGAGSEPGGLGSREGSGAGGSTMLGSFRGFWMPAAWGRVMRTGVNVSYGLECVRSGTARSVRERIGT